MMTTTALTEFERAECRNFLEGLTNSAKSEDDDSASFPHDNQFESLCFCVTDEEIPGELTDIINRFLHYRKCPDILIGPLISYVLNKFQDTDLTQFKLERKDDESTEYNASSLSKHLYQVFLKSCLDFISNFDSMTIQKNPQSFHVSLQAVRNRRRRMEDRHVYYTDLNSLLNLDEAQTGQALFAVFDGHGGIDAANYAASHLLTHLKACPNLITQPGEALHKAILKTDEEFIKKGKREKLRSGATAVVVLIQGLNLTVAWLGDSQVVLCKAGDAVQLMDPHKPNRPDERARIESLGGCVVNFGGWRVNGILAVARSIGDSEQKPYVTGEPDVEEYEMEGDEEFVILACDGLWDTVEPFDAVQLVRKCMEEGTRDSAAGKLVDLAIKQRSMDNISILVVYFDFNGPVVFSADNTTNSEEMSEANNEDEKGDIKENHQNEDLNVKGQVSDEREETQEKANDEKPAAHTEGTVATEGTISSKENT
ncbi:protein phosphatase 1F-like [Clytia hemisphaerica]|uniref:PPM-type phosphatase domain-containing protein n=1 Tax=Clytia hemisphaerica TaxID=252671 RepID=A0A7M5UXI7_9CNID